MRPGASARSIPSTAWIVAESLLQPDRLDGGRPAPAPRPRGIARAHGVSPASAGGHELRRPRPRDPSGSGTMRSTTGRVMRWKKIGPTNAWSARIGCIGRIRPAAIWPRDVLRQGAEGLLEERPMPSTRARTRP